VCVVWVSGWMDWFWDLIFRTKRKFMEEHKLSESQSYLVIIEQSWYKLLCYKLVNPTIKTSLYVSEWVSEWVCGVCMCVRVGWGGWRGWGGWLHVFSHFRMVVCVCACVCMCTCMHVCVYAWECVCAHPYIHTLSLSLSHTHTHTCNNYSRSLPRPPHLSIPFFFFLGGNKILKSQPHSHVISAVLSRIKSGG